jgi:hypothetical protein
MDTGFFLGVIPAGRGVDHPPPSSAEVNERVQLYLYSPYGPSRSVLGRILPLPPKHATTLPANVVYARPASNCGFIWLNNNNTELQVLSDLTSMVQLLRNPSGVTIQGYDRHDH